MLRHPRRKTGKTKDNSEGSRDSIAKIERRCSIQVFIQGKIANNSDNMHIYYPHIYSSGSQVVVVHSHSLHLLACLTCF